ncbi:MAG: short-subunit dehydrogenase [Myxococcota bacterium]|jgi:short-subunit dehydrogenase
MHVLLTGASSGIGAALAQAFSAAGHSLTLVARREDRLRALAETLGPTQVLVRDLLDPAAVEGLAEAAVAALGPVDVLVNNAGMELLAASHRLDPGQAERLLRLNLLVPLQLTRQVLPAMRDRGSGCIVDVASVAAFASQPFATHYCASKAGLAAAGRQLRWELAGSGVHVLTVYPGPIHTEMGQRALSAYATDPSGGWLPWGTADELSRRILRAIDRRQGELVYPSIYRVARWVPALTAFITQRTRAALRD